MSEPSPNPFSHELADTDKWLDLARNPATPPKLLAHLASSVGTVDIRVLVAHHHQADAVVLTILARDTALPVRLAVIGRPNLPQSVLSILTNDSVGSIRQTAITLIKRDSEPTDPLELAGSMWTSQEQLKSLLLHSSGRVRRAAMRNQSTPSDAVQRLKCLEQGDPQLTPKEFEHYAAAGPYARGLVAKHPNAPEKLLEEFVTEVFRNDVAINPRTPQRLLEILRIDPEVRPFVAKNPNVPIALQNEFLIDKLWNVREALASNPKASRMVLEVFSLDADWEVREALAENPAISPDVIDRLARDPWDLVRELAAAHPNAAPGTLNDLASDLDQDVQLAVAENANTSPETLERLSVHADNRIRAAVAAHPNIPQSLLDRLSEDTSVWVQRLTQWRDPDVSPAALTEAARTRKTASRVMAAMNPNTPPAILERLALDEHPRVRAFVIGNPNCPAQAVEILKTDARADVQIIALALEFVGFSEELVLQTFSKQEAMRYLRSPDARFRRAIAASPRTIPERLETFARDHDRGVLLALSANPKTPTYILQGLAHDEALRRTVALNPNAAENVQVEVERLDVEAASTQENTGVTRLRRYARNPRVPVRVAVATNTITPADLLQQLASDQDANVRIEVIRNLNTSATTLNLFTRDTDRRVRLALAQRVPIIYPELLTALANDQDSLIRQAVAERSETPIDALEKLSAYSNLHLIIAGNPNANSSILDSVVRSNKPEVWALVSKHPNSSGKTLEYMANDLFGSVLHALNFSKEGWLHSFLRGRTQTHAPLYEQISRHPNITPRLKKHFSRLRQAGYLKQNVFLDGGRRAIISPEVSGANITIELPPLRSVIHNQEPSSTESGEEQN